MADSLINGLAPLTDAQVDDDTREFAMADATSGISGRGAMAQVKKAVGTQKVKYVASGSEGVTLTISDIAGRDIIAIYREGAAMYEVTATPDSVEFIWDTTNITLGLAANPGERFLILFKNL